MLTVKQRNLRREAEKRFEVDRKKFGDPFHPGFIDSAKKLGEKGGLDKEVIVVRYLRLLEKWKEEFGDQRR